MEKRQRIKRNSHLRLRFGVAPTNLLSRALRLGPVSGKRKSTFPFDFIVDLTALIGVDVAAATAALFDEDNSTSEDVSRLARKRSTSEPFDPDTPDL